MNSVWRMSDKVSKCALGLGEICIDRVSFLHQRSNSPMVVSKCGRIEMLGCVKRIPNMVSFPIVQPSF